MTCFLDSVILRRLLLYLFGIFGEGGHDKERTKRADVSGAVWGGIS